MEPIGKKTKKIMCKVAMGAMLSLPLAAFSAPFTMQAVEEAGKNIQEVTAVPGSQAKELQALLDTNTGGDALVVNIPAGNYELNSTLYISSNTTIRAEKDAHFIKTKVYGAMLEGKLTNDKGGYGGCHDIAVEGGIWDSKPVMDGEEGTETFRFIHCSGVSIKDVVLCNVPEGSHLVVFSGTENATVENCEFYGYGRGGDGKTEKEALQFDVAHDVETTPTFQDVFWDELPCRNITIQNCNFHDYSRAFGSHTAVKGIYHDGIVLKNNTVKNISDIAFKLFNYTNTTISGNTFENCGWGVFVYTWLDVEESADGGRMYLEPLKERTLTLPEDCNVVIENNTFTMGEKGKTEGDAVRICGSGEIPLPGVTVRNNIISDSRRYGIFATHAPRLEISGNQISNTKTNGILIEQDSTAAVIRNNAVKSAGGLAAIGVYTGSDGAVVAGNELTTPKGSGIYLYNGVKNCVVGPTDKAAKDTDGNTITKPGTTGIHITNDCSENTVQYNKITQAAEDGIWVYSSKNNKIIGNSISSCGNTGIHVTEKSSGNTVNSNTIDKPGENGIWLHDSEKCSVSSNTVTSPKTIGIYVTEKSNKAVLKKNKITSAGEDGIWVSGSTGSTVSSNTIKGYAGKAEKNYGIGIYQSGGTKSAYVKVEGNTITGSGKKTTNDAIRVSTSDYVLVNKNTIKTPAGYGVYIYKSKNSKTSANKITKPVKGGIYATTECDKATISGNTVSTPGDTAIMIYQAKASTVTGNTVKTTSTLAGIRISQSNNTAVKKNKVTGAKKGQEVWITGSEGCKEEGNTIE